MINRGRIAACCGVVIKPVGTSKLTSSRQFHNRFMMTLPDGISRKSPTSAEVGQRREWDDRPQQVLVT